MEEDMNLKSLNFVSFYEKESNSQFGNRMWPKSYQVRWIMKKLNILASVKPEENKKTSYFQDLFFYWKNLFQ